MKRDANNFRLTSALTAFIFISQVGLGVAKADGPVTDPDKRTQMANAFQAGAEAYKAGQYAAAAEAFEKAYSLVPSAALLFSAAQAHRRQYLAEPSPERLRRAISLYRDYLRVDPQANRREDAMEALQTLVPLERITPLDPAALTDPSKDGANSDGASSTKKTARLLLSSGVTGAEVSLDNGPFASCPLVASVEPGPHRARFRGKGYTDEEVTLDAIAREQVQRHVELRPKPAQLVVEGPAEAQVSVDGRLVATLPGAPVSLEPGSHFVSVTLRGHEPLGETVVAKADDTVRVPASLPLTRQRKLAWVGLATGALGVVASSVLLGLTFARQSDALRYSDRPSSDPLNPSELSDYNRAVNERNSFGQAAAITGAVSGLVFGAGVGLFLADRAEIAIPAAAPPTPGLNPTFEVGLGSASFSLQF